MKKCHTDDDNVELQAGGVRLPRSISDHNTGAQRFYSLPHQFKHRGSLMLAMGAAEDATATGDSTDPLAGTPSILSTSDSINISDSRKIRKPEDGEEPQQQRGDAGGDNKAENPSTSVAHEHTMEQDSQSPSDRKRTGSKIRTDGDTPSQATANESASEKKDQAGDSSSANEQEREKEKEREREKEKDNEHKTEDRAPVDPHRKRGCLYKLGMMGRKKRHYYGFFGNHLIWWDTQEVSYNCHTLLFISFVIIFISMDFLLLFICFLMCRHNIAV